MYAMKFGVEKEAHEEKEPQEEEPMRGDQPALETMGKKGIALQNTPVTEVHRRCSSCNATIGVPTEGRLMATFLSIFMKLPLTPRMNGHIATRRWWWNPILEAFSQRRWSLLERLPLPLLK